MSEPGDRFTLFGQRYTCLRIEPCVTVDGRDSEFSIWEAACPEPGCGAMFEVQLRPDFPLGHVKLNRRCPKHRAPGVPVKAYGKRTRNRTTPPDRIRAARYLFECRRWTGKERWTSGDAVKQVHADAAALPKAVAQQLGCEASTPDGQYRAVYKVLRLAVRMRLMVYVTSDPVPHWITHPSQVQ